MTFFFFFFFSNLKVHCHAIQWFFVDFLRQKNGADPTEAAPDQTNRGAGLVKIRASRSRDSACGNRSESRRPAIRPSLQRGAQDWAAVRVSHHLVLPRYRAFFFLVLSLPGRHTNDRTLAQCRCECPGPRLPLRRSARVKSSSWRCPPNRGQRQKRLNWPELITILVKAREKCCHLTESCLYLLRERKE